MAGALTRCAIAAVLAAGLATAPHAVSAQTSAATEAEPTPTVASTLNRVPSPDVPLHTTAAASPDGRFVMALQTRPAHILWILPTDGGAPFSLRDNWSAWLPRWSPTGDRIGFIAGIGPPRVWTVELDPRTGRPIDPPRMLIRSSVNAFAFAPDGERVAVVPARSTAAGTSQIRVVDWSSRASRTIAREAGMIYWLDWAPDGERIYYGLAPGADSAHSIRSVRVRDGTISIVRGGVAEFLGLSPEGTRLLYVVRDQADAAYELEVEIAPLADGPVCRLSLPAGPPPRWGPDSSSLLRVRPGDPGGEITLIRLGGQPEAQPVEREGHSPPRRPGR